VSRPGRLRGPLLSVVAASVLTGCPATSPDPRPSGPPRGVADEAPLPEPRTEVAGTAWRDGVVVAGGLLRDGRTSAGVDRWTAGTGWERLPDLPAPRHHAGLAVRAGRLLVVGGYDGAGAPSADVWSLGDGDARWRPEAALPQPRAAAAVVAVDDRVVVAGGVLSDGAAGDPEVTSSTVALDDAGWTAGPALAAAREHLAGASAAGRVYAVAGRTGGLDTNLDVVESLGPGETAWRRELPVPAPRGGTSAAGVGDLVCVAGGEDPDGTDGSVVCLDENGWHEVARLSEPRHGLAVVALDGRLHVVAGGPRPGLTVSGRHEVVTPRL
jgi:hypothetical protein